MEDDLKWNKISNARQSQLEDELKWKMTIKHFAWNVILNKNLVCQDNLRMYGEACYWSSNQPIRRELGVETAEVAGISREQPRN